MMESLKEAPQQWDKHPCPYCGGRVVYTSNANIYGGRVYGNGKCYFCTNCEASVGVHSNSDGTGSRRPLGILATPNMRKLKQDCHTIFDEAWKSQKIGRSKCYQRLAELMRIDVKICHFGYFTERDLRRALKVMEPEDWYM